jgi:hypothetical protein
MDEEKQVNNEQISEVATTNESSEKITFDNEKAFMSRVQREAKKQMQEFVKNLGFENDNQLKEVVQKQKEFEESQKTEYEKLQEQLKQKTEYIDKANQNLKNAEIKAQVLNSGIKQERLNYALKLLDTNNIEFNDGQLNTEQLSTQINNLLSEFPELKGAPQQQKVGQDFSQAKTNDLLTLEAIKNMSVEEAERRLPDILKFLEKK